MGLNRYYETGILIGALPGGWTHSQYQSLTRELWKGIRGETPFAVIEIARDGSKFHVGAFQDKSKASEAYGKLTSDPQWAVYIAYFDWDVPKGEDELIDEAFFQPTDIIKTETRNVPFAVKAGMGLAGVLGLLALIAKH